MLLPYFLRLNGEKMREKVYSNTMKKVYYPDECIRIINPLQAAAYWVNGCEPVDIFPSRDSNTGQPISVFVFNKEKSKPLFKKWMDYELK